MNTEVEKLILSHLIELKRMLQGTHKVIPLWPAETEMRVPGLEDKLPLTDASGKDENEPAWDGGINDLHVGG